VTGSTYRSCFSATKIIRPEDGSPAEKVESCCIKQQGARY